MTYFNKIKDLTIELPKIIVPRVGGEFELEAFQGFEFPKGSGKVWEYPGTVRRLAKFDNLITDLGLDYYGQGWNPGTGVVSEKYWQTNYCQVGTGTAAESAADTSLSSFTAAVIYTGSLLTGHSAQGTPPYYGSHRTEYLFSPNFAGGNVNINEIGVGFTLASGSLSSRALTKDNDGNPATVPVLATEYLRAYYTRRNYPGHIIELTGAPDDLTGSVLIGGVSYNYTMRPAFVTNNDWGQECQHALTTFTGFGGSNGVATAYGSDSALGAVTTGISSASSGQATSGSAGSYTLNSYNRTLSYFWDIGQGNVSGGIKGIEVKSSLGCYQILLSAAVPKNSGNALTYYHNWAWARK